MELFQNMLWIVQVLFMVPLCVAEDQVTTPAQNDGCNDTPLDLVFVLDSSHSIWIPHFRRELSFVNDVLSSFDIGPEENQTHVALLTFGHTVWPQFYFNTYKHLSEIKLAVKRIKHGRGKTTNTGDALRYARDIMYSDRTGARSNVSKVAVVVSDGRSQKTWFTQSVARQLQQQGILLFSVSLGFRQDHKELGAIASDPDSEHMFDIDDYDEIKSVHQRILDRVCNVTQPLSQKIFPTTTTQLPGDEQFISKDSPFKDCENKRADIFFLVDASYSIEKDEFGKEMEFVHDIIDVLDIGENKTRIGLLTFSDVTEFYIRLSYKLRKEDYQQHLNYVNYMGGGTDTATALRRMREEGFLSDAYQTFNNADVAKIAIVLTDGLSLTPDITAQEAELAHKMGIQIFAIGIGNGVDKVELQEIASKPESNFVLHVDDFGSLQEIKSQLAARSCTVKPVEPMPNDQAVCSPTKPTDLMFVYDTVAIGSWKSQAISQFLAKSVRELDLVSGNLRVGRETENCPSGNIPLGSVLQASALSLVRYSTFADMLRKVTRSRFSIENGGRKDSLKMAVLIVDTKQRISYEVLQEMKKMEDAVHFFHIVGIGEDDNQISLLKKAAGSGKFMNIFNYDELSSFADTLMSEFCDFFFQLY